MRHRILLSAAPTLLAVLALTGCGSTSASDDGADPDPDAAPAAATNVATQPRAPRVSFPAAVDTPEQGGRYAAVVLATGSDAELDESVRSVAGYGYTAAVSDVGCLAGLSEALELPDDALVSSLLFADRATAREFADAYILAEDGLMVGRAVVTAYCLN